MRKLLSTTVLAAALAFGGAAWAQTSGTAGGTPGGAGAPGAGGTSASGHAGANQPTQSPSIAPLGQQTGQMMDESKVRDMLSKQGFSNVENVTRSGNNYHAHAMQNGRPMDLTIDATTGTIHSQAAAR